MLPGRCEKELSGPWRLMDRGGQLDKRGSVLVPLLATEGINSAGCGSGLTEILTVVTGGQRSETVPDTVLTA